MRLVLLLAFALPAVAQEQEVQRALIERDHQSAEFAARLRGAPLEEIQRLENLSARQLQEIRPDSPKALRPYERQKAARETEAFVLRLPPPVVRTQETEKPLPLPAQMPPAVDVVPGEG
jgi:hypothetical protein